jgi:hypothetical protein
VAPVANPTAETGRITRKTIATLEIRGDLTTEDIERMTLDEALAFAKQHGIPIPEERPSAQNTA